MAGPKQFPLAILIRAVDQASAPLRKVQAQVNGMLAPVRRFQAGMRQLGETSGVTKLGRALGGVVGGVRNLAGAGLQVLRRVAVLGGAAAAAVYALVRGYTQLGDTVAKQADRIGIGIESLQELRFAAGRAGVQTEALDKALLDQGKRIGEARNRTGALYTLLDRADPTLLRQLERTHDQGEAFRLLVGYLHKTEDAQTRLAIANAVWGRAGAKLLTLTKGGAEGLDQMAARARELGAVIGEEDARAAEVFEDSIGDLFTALLGLRNLLAAAVVPELRSLIDQAVAWVVRVRPQVQAFARDFAAGLPERIQQVVAWFQRMAQEAQPVLKVGSWLVDTFGAVNVTMAAVGITIGGPLISALTALIPLVWKLGAALLSTPVGWVLAAIAGLVAGIWWLYDEWESVLGFLTFLWDGVVGAISTAVGWLERFLGLAPIEVGGVGGGRGDLARRSASGAARQSAAELFAAGGASSAPARDDRVRVVFDQVPKGVRVEHERGAGVELDVGYSMGL